MDLSQTDWTEKLNNSTDAIILDVRTEEEIAEGFIKGAIFNDIYRGQAFIDELEKLDKSKQYFVYCKAGGRSYNACKIMNELGFEKTYNLVGGFMNWQGEIVR